MKSLISPRRLAIGVAAALTLALVPSLVAAQAASNQYRASLGGANEVPANASTATGTFTATLDEAAGTLAWTLNVPTITNMTMSHIHQGAPGANGGVVLDLVMPPSGGTLNTVDGSGTAKLSDLLKGPLAGNVDGFVTALKAGNLYVNVHTQANPGGEIRGQVVSATAATATPTAAPTTAAQATATPAATTTGTTSPAPAKTGSAGLVDASATSLLLVAGLVAAAGAVTLAARRATRGR